MFPNDVIVHVQVIQITNMGVQINHVYEYVD